MAIGRFKATRAWFRRVALDVQDHPRLARELMRAADRPGKIAEITGGEARVLAERRPNDPIVTDVIHAVLASEERDLARRALTQRILERHRAANDA